MFARVLTDAAAISEGAEPAARLKGAADAVPGLAVALPPGASAASTVAGTLPMAAKTFSGAGPAALASVAEAVGAQGAADGAMVDPVEATVQPEEPSAHPALSRRIDDKAPGATSGVDTALMQWMLQMVPVAPVPVAVQALASEPAQAGPGLHDGAALQPSMVAAGLSGLSGRIDWGGRDGAGRVAVAGSGRKEAGPGAAGAANATMADGVAAAFAGATGLKPSVAAVADSPRGALPVREAGAGPMSPAASAADGARLPSWPEPGEPQVPSASTGRTADLQALVSAAVQTATVSTVAMPAGNPVPAPAQTWIQTPVTQPGFANEVVVALVRDVSQFGEGTHALTLHLNPEALGPVSVSIELQGSAARIAFSASEALTRQHLEAALPELGQALQEQGVSLAQAGVHEASKESLAASAAGSSAYGGTGSDGRQRGETPFDGRSGYGEHAPRRETAVFSVDAGAMADPRVPASNVLPPGRAGRLDLFA